MSDLTLTVTEVAERLKCSKKTVYRLIAQKALPSLKLGYRTVRVPVDAVAALLKGRRSTSKPARRKIAELWLNGKCVLPDQLFSVFNRALYAIDLAGDKAVKCRLQFETESGEPYVIEVALPDETLRDWKTQYVKGSLEGVSPPHSD